MPLSNDELNVLTGFKPRKFLWFRWMSPTYQKLSRTEAISRCREMFLRDHQPAVVFLPRVYSLTKYHPDDFVPEVYWAPTEWPELRARIEKRTHRGTRFSRPSSRAKARIELDVMEQLVEKARSLPSGHVVLIPYRGSCCSEEYGSVSDPVEPLTIDRQEAWRILEPEIHARVGCIDRSSHLPVRGGGEVTLSIVPPRGVAVYESCSY